jgi:hypothetical protein
VDRAFIEEAGRIVALPGLDLKTPVGPPVSAVESQGGVVSQAAVINQSVVTAVFLSCTTTSRSRPRGEEEETLGNAKATADAEESRTETATTILESGYQWPGPHYNPTPGGWDLVLTWTTLILDGGCNSKCHHKPF